MSLSERFNLMTQNEQQLAELKLGDSVGNRDEKTSELTRRGIQLFLEGETELLPVLDHINDKGKELSFIPIDACLSLVQILNRGERLIRLEHGFELTTEQEAMGYEELEELTSQLETYVSENFVNWLHDLDSELKISTGKVTVNVHGNLLLVSGRYQVRP